MLSVFGFTLPETANDIAYCHRTIAQGSAIRVQVVVQVDDDPEFRGSGQFDRIEQLFISKAELAGHDADKSRPDAFGHTDFLAGTAEPFHGLLRQHADEYGHDCVGIRLAAYQGFHQHALTVEAEAGILED